MSKQLYHWKSNQIIFIGLRSSKDYYKRPGGVMGVYGKGHLWWVFLRGSMLAEGMSCWKRWVRWALRGTGTASGHPGKRFAHVNRIKRMSARILQLRHPNGSLMSSNQVFLKVLTALSLHISLVLAQMFNISHQTAQAPEDWRCNRKTPTHNRPKAIHAH